MRIQFSIVTLAAVFSGLVVSHAETIVAAPRTGAYADVMVNAAADNTINDYTKRPTLIGDQQYIVGGGGTANGTNLANGAFSIKGGAFNWFGMMTANTAPEGPDFLNFGMANTKFGAGLAVAFAKSDTSLLGTETRTTDHLDGLAAFGDIRLTPNSDVYGRLGITTDYQGLATDMYRKTTFGTVTTESKNSVFGVLAGWKMDANKEGDNSLNLEAALNVGDKKDAASSDTGSLLVIGVTLSHGVILKQSETFAVFAGSNTQFTFIGETRNKTDSTRITVNASPNIEFQKTLGKGFEAFSGAAGSLMYSTFDGGTSFSTWDLWTTGADVSVGLRWNYENFAIEGKVQDALLFNGPNVVGGMAPGLFSEVGLALGF